MIKLKTNYKLKFYIAKKIFVQMIPDRKIFGILRGYDQFLNLILDEGFLIGNKNKKFLGTVLLRGDMIISLGSY